MTVETNNDENGRVDTLDVIRGFALFGILFVNVHIFINPHNWFEIDWQNLSNLEYGVEVFKLIFSQGKFYSLFALLFGVGFAMQLASAERRGRGFVIRFLWRMVLLWFLGILHFFLLWHGDILNSYAVAGIILLSLFVVKRYVLDKLFNLFSSSRTKVPRGWALVVASIFIGGFFTNFATNIYYDNRAIEAHRAGLELNAEQHRAVKQREFMLNYKAERVEREQILLETYQTGSFSKVFDSRIIEAPFRLGTIAFWFIICGLFLIGAYIGRQNYIINAKQHRRGFELLIMCSFVVAVLGNIGFVYANVAVPADAVPFAFWFWLMFFTKTVAGLATALVFIGVFSLLMLGSARRYVLFLAPVGQMAVSNYLLQSAITGIIFYGYGLSLMTHLNVVGQFIYILVLFACQVMFSHWWLSRYQFGPVEWLWRSLTYFKCQPMKASSVGTN